MFQHFALRILCFDNDEPAGYVGVLTGDELLPVKITAYAPDMAAMLDYWDKSDDVIKGKQAVVDQGQKYLPKFADEEKDEYAVRLSLTKFTNVFRDIVDSLAAKPFEQELTLTTSDKETEAPQEIVDFFEDVDGAGNNMNIFAKRTMFNGIKSAIDWIFVDYPNVADNVVKTKADQKALALRPYWLHVRGRHMLEARRETINSKQVLTYVRVSEPSLTEKKDAIRVMYRDEKTGSIHWDLYRYDEKTERYYLDDYGTLSITIIPYFPFIAGQPEGATFEILPPMSDALELQLDLYRAESGLEFIKTLAAYPMLNAEGIIPEKDAQGKPKKLKIGAARVLYSPPSNNTGTAGKFHWIEPSADNQRFLKDDIKDIKLDLRELGRQPLTAQSSSLTIIAAGVAATKGRSAVVSWANSLKDTLENALLCTAEYMNLADYDPQLNIYTDFDDIVDNQNNVNALLKAHEQGVITDETLYEELKRYGVLSSDNMYVTEIQRFATQRPKDDTRDIVNG